jgi:hypothetical protein
MEIKLLEIISYRYFPESLSKSTIYIFANKGCYCTQKQGKPQILTNPHTHASQIPQSSAIYSKTRKKKPIHTLNNELTS